jgi:hypothetical protein
LLRRTANKARSPIIFCECCIQSIASILKIRDFRQIVALALN